MYEAITDMTALGIPEEMRGEYPFKTTTLAISEMTTDFTMQMLDEIQPKSFTDLIYFSGLSHGTNVWTGNQRELVVEEGMALSDIIPVRDIIFQQLTEKGIDPKVSFGISEIIRKGKQKADPDKWQEYKELMVQHGMPEWYIRACDTIQYMFPKAHAVAYVMNAMRIFWYKLNTPRVFYCAVLGRYGVNKNNNKNFDYMGASGIKNVAELKAMWKKIDEDTNNPAKIKDNQRIASIIWELKLRGYELKKANLESRPDKFSPDPNDSSTILMPLLSIKGIGENSADKIHKAAKLYRKETGHSITSLAIEELMLVVDENGKKVFDKRIMDALANHWMS